MKLTDLIPAPYRLWAWLAVAAVAAIVVMVLGAKLGAALKDPLGWGEANRAQDRAGNIVGQHGKAASDAAARAEAAFNDRQSGRDQLGKVNRDDILSQKDAGADAGDTGRAFLRSLCRWEPDNPRCAGLQRQDPAQPPR